jgi:hypothetical protein
VPTSPPGGLLLLAGASSADLEGEVLEFGDSSAHTGRLEGLVGTFEATPLVGESTEEACHAARDGWCGSPPTDDAQGSRRLTGTVVRLKLTPYGKDFQS